MRHLLLTIALIALTAIAATLLGLWTWNQSSASPELPLAKNIVRMHVKSLSHHKANANANEFDIPETYWQPILSVLAATKKDSHPAKWGVVGDLTISRDDGSTFLVTVYGTDMQYAAVSAGKDWESRIYYRGGSETKLLSLLTEAQAFAKPSGKE